MRDLERELQRLRHETAEIAALQSTRRTSAADPGLLEFTFSDAFLRTRPFPRQTTLMKMWDTSVDVFTQYDLDVIGEWTEEFAETGERGVQPDYWERRRRCQDEARPWFREFEFIGGRRGGKGFLGSILGAYVTYQHTYVLDRDALFGIDPDKEMVGMVIGPNVLHAKQNLYADLTNRIRGAACFKPIITKSLGGSMTLLGPVDETRTHDGVLGDPTTYRVEATGTTLTGVRGPSTYMLLFDEMAWMITTSGGSKSAEDVYRAAVPSLDEVGKYGFIFVGSSPWQKTGEFHALYQRSLETDENGDPTYPEILMAQLASWDPYKDYELTDPSLGSRRLRLYPEDNVAEAQHFFFDSTGTKVEFLPQKRKAIQQYDDQMRQLERANPEAFKVERRSLFASVQAQYLADHIVDGIFVGFDGVDLSMQSEGRLGTRYLAHGDPSKSGANFGFAIAHVVYDEATQRKHVVFDVLNAWEPASFEQNNYEIDYDQIALELASYMDRFNPAEFTLDQFNSVQLLQSLRKHAALKQYPKQVSIFERRFTRAENYMMSETFKTAAGLGLIHAPYLELAELELKFLQDRGNQLVSHPTTGPVQHSDIWDCMKIITWFLIGDHIDEISAALSNTPLGMALPAGNPMEVMTPQEQLSSFNSGGNGERRRSKDGGRLLDPRDVRRRRPPRVPGQRARN